MHTIHVGDKIFSISKGTWFKTIEILIQSEWLVLGPLYLLLIGHEVTDGA